MHSPPWKWALLLTAMRYMYTASVDHSEILIMISQATEFREFWGAKAGLRRFKDGSIREAVVWVDGGGVACGRTIPALIIRHLLER